MYAPIPTIMVWLAAVVLLVVPTGRLTAATPPAETKSAGADQALLRETTQKGIEYLKSVQEDDGSYNSAAGPGVTALVTTALMRGGLGPDDPAVAKSLRHLEGFVHDDGGIYQEGSNHRNYETCLAIMCFAEANRNGRYEKLLQHAKQFIEGIQWDEADGHDESSYSYGGAGYGSHKRPDLSNTQMFIAALRSAGSGPNDEAIQKALIFVSRCQNLESPHNTTPFSTKNPDGGFYYTAASGGLSQAGKTSNGGLRSYGSMTYAGLKSMIYAGVSRDDQRVQAADRWIRKNYTLEENPGMGSAGLYYYYHTFAKALEALGEKQITDGAGTEHNWRADLVEELARRQRENGSWVNDNDRWLEGDPTLVTGYALLALSYCSPADADAPQSSPAAKP